MRPLYQTWVISTLTFGFISTGAQSFTEDHNNFLPKAQRTAYARVQQQVIRPKLISVKQNFPHIVNGYLRTLVEQDQFTGASRVIRLAQEQQARKNALPTPAAIKEKAFDFMASNPEEFYVFGSNYQVNEDSILIAPDIQALTMVVYRDNLKIDDASVTFHFKNGEIFQVINNSFAEVEGQKIDDYNVERLRRIAEDSLYSRRTIFSRDVYRIRENEYNQYELIHVVEFNADVQGVPYLVQIEAATGYLYETVSTMIHVNAKAQATLYDRWYSDPLELKPLKELKISNDVYTDNDGNFDASAVPKKIELMGRRVKIKDKGRKAINLADNKRDDGVLSYFFERDPNNKVSKKLEDDRLTSQVMGYYHVTEIAQYAEKYIPQTKWLQQPLETNVNVGGFLGLMSCNAFWNGKSINFYKGSRSCANTGLLADVIYHEWGHGLDANTGGINDRGFSEGYGDMVAMLMTGSSQLGVGFNLPNHDPVRELETDKIYPQDKTYEPHAEGLIIASTMWDLYTMLRATYSPAKSKDIMANYIFKVIYTANKYTEVYNALIAIDDDDGDLKNGTPNYCYLNKAFAAHGLADRDKAMCPN